MTKKYTTAQYEAFLKQPFRSNFGIDFNTVWNDVSSSTAFKSIIRDYGISADYFKNKCIPVVKQILGENAYFMYLMIMYNEGHGSGSSFDFINWTYRENADADIKDTSNHIKDLLASKSYPPAVTAPEVPGGMPGASACQKCLNECPTGSIGRYYIPSTLAGNAWVWGTSWAQNQYFGNPYDVIIDYIKSKGKDPFNASGNGSGDSSTGGSGSGDDYSDPSNPLDDLSGANFAELMSQALAQGTQAVKDLLDKLFPKAVYLNNSKFSVLGLRFRRYQQYLYLTYPWEYIGDALGDLVGNITGGSNDDSGSGDSGSGDSGSGDNTSDWYQKIETELNKIRNKKFSYENVRPQPDLQSVSYADCSSFAGWISRTAFPKMWNGGYTNTGTQLPLFKGGGVGSVAWTGTLKGLINNQDKVKDGDFLIMGQSPDCGAGLASHIAWVENKNSVWSMEGRGLLNYSLSYFLNTWWSERPYMNVCRPS